MVSQTIKSGNAGLSMAHSWCIILRMEDGILSSSAGATWSQFNYFIEDSWKFCEVRIWCRQSRWGCCVIIVSVRACARIAMIILGTKIAAWECLGPMTVPVVLVWCTRTGTVHIAIFKTPPSRTVGVRKAEHRRYWPVRNFYHPLAFTVQ